MNSAETGTMADQKTTGNQEAKAEPTEQKIELELEGKTEGHGGAVDHSRVNSETAFMAIIGNSRNSCQCHFYLYSTIKTTHHLRLQRLHLRLQKSITVMK